MSPSQGRAESVMQGPHVSLEEQQSLEELGPPPTGAALHSLDQILVLTLIPANGRLY